MTKECVPNQAWVTPGLRTRFVQPACPARSHSIAVPSRSLLDHTTWPTRLTVQQESRGCKSSRSSRTKTDSWPLIECLSARPSDVDLSGVHGAGRVPAGRAPWWTLCTLPGCERDSRRRCPPSSTRASHWWWGVGRPRRAGTWVSSCREITVWGFPLLH